MRVVNRDDRTQAHVGLIDEKHLFMVVEFGGFENAHGSCLLLTKLPFKNVCETATRYFARLSARVTA